MKPLNSNNQSCNPISSNCVIWQGPDLECIKLCKGDTVTDVVFKIATELCELMEMTDISSYDLSCLNLQNCNPSDFQGLVQLIINNLCAINEANGNRQGSVTPGCPDCTVNIASCFYYFNEFGDQITSMQLTDYARTIGNRVCDIITEITNINLVLSNHEIRITALEDEPPPTVVLPQVTPTCVLPSIPSTLQTTLSAVEQQFCQLRSSTGLPTQIYSSIASQCVNLNSSPSLGVAGSVMSSLPGWVVSPTNLADSINNLWLTICDLRSAVFSIQQTCCPSGCDGVEINISATFDGTFIRIYLTGTLPTGFLDCDSSGNLFTISDTTGGSISQRINIASTINASPSATINVSGTVLNLGSDFDIHTDACVRNASTNAQCQFCIDYVLDNNANCPALTVSTVTDTSLSYSFTVVNAGTYAVQLWNFDGTVLIAENSTVVVVPGVITDTFTGLTASTNYRVRIVATVGTTTTDCPFVPVTTTPIVCTAPTSVAGSIELPVECEDCGESIDFVSNPSVEGYYADDDAPVLRYYDGAIFDDLLAPIPALPTGFSVPGGVYADRLQRQMAAVNNPSSIYNAHVFIMDSTNEEIHVYLEGVLITTITDVTFINPPDPVTTTLAFCSIVYSEWDDKIYYTHGAFLGSIDLANSLAVTRNVLIVGGAMYYMSYNSFNHKLYIGQSGGINEIQIVALDPTPVVETVVNPTNYPSLLNWGGATQVACNSYNGDVWIPIGNNVLTPALNILVLDTDNNIITTIDHTPDTEITSTGLCFYPGNGVAADARVYIGYFDTVGLTYLQAEYNAATYTYVSDFISAIAGQSYTAFNETYNKMLLTRSNIVRLYDIAGNLIQTYNAAFNITNYAEDKLNDTIYLTGLVASPADNTLILGLDEAANIQCTENITKMFLTVGPLQTGPYIFGTAWESACNLQITDSGSSFIVTATFPALTSMLGAILTYSINDGITWLPLGTTKTEAELALGVSYLKGDIPDISFRLRLAFLTQDNCGLASAIDDTYYIP